MIGGSSGHVPGCAKDKELFEALILSMVFIPLLFCAYYLCAHSKRISELELENKLAQESIKALHERIYHLSKKL